MPARKSKKNRKHGRGKRNNRNVRQAARTETNKSKRMNRERAKSGKPALPVMQNTIIRQKQAADNAVRVERDKRFRKEAAKLYKRKGIRDVT